MAPMARVAISMAMAVVCSPDHSTVSGESAPLLCALTKKACDVPQQLARDVLAQ